jgi:type VI secretion system secreted protein VgrG
MPRSLDIATPLGAGVLTIVSFNGAEALSQLSAFRIGLKSRRPDIAGEEMLGQNVTIYLELHGRKARYFNGYVTRWSGVAETFDATPGQKATKAFLYQATVSPWLWFLQRQSNSRMFQNKTVPQIVQEVFGKHGGLASYKLDVRRSYPVWEYCCQYRESDFRFVSRLLEQEGIYYYIEHDNGKHLLVLADSSSQHVEAEGYEEVRFDEVSRQDAETLRQWQGHTEIQSGRYVVDDYNFKKPKTKMDAMVERQRSHPYAGYEIYDHPAEYDEPGDARQIAGTRLDELQTQYQVFGGSGNVRGLQPGKQFKLARHPVEAFNTKLLVVQASYNASSSSDVSGAGSGFEFGCEVAAIPATQQYRPARDTPKPYALGPQTAVVVGPAGEEIHTDEHARIKVQFRWDRYGKADQNSSCWIRVAQPWAGNGYGALAIPRVGQEVIVEFLHGDPDWPLVVGSVYNGQNVPPYSLPAEKTRWGLKSRSSKGGGSSNFNELRFEDKMGAEEVYLHAERDHNLFIKNDRKERIGNESHLEVEKDALAKYGADVHRQTTGDELTQVDGGVHFKVGQDWHAKVGTLTAVDAGQEIHLKAGTNVVIEAGAQLTLKVGGNFVNINAGGVYIKGSMVMINSGGSAGSGSGASPKAPKAAKQAEGSKGGTDAPPSPKVATLVGASAASTPFTSICG